MPLPLTEPHPLAALIESLSARAPIGAALRSAEWARVAQGLRARAFFSATVEEVRWLSAFQKRLTALLSGERGVDRPLLVLEMARLGRQLGLEPADPALRGTIQDPTSERRLRLIIETQLEMAYGYGEYLSGQDPLILNEWPAYELIRLRQSRVPRDWVDRWAKAGGQLYTGRRLALKTADTWRRISRFGNPFPPFDFNSGMGLREVDRAEAEALGLLPAGQILQPTVEAFNTHLQASTKSLPPRALAALKTIFGEQVEEEEGSLRWRPER